MMRQGIPAALAALGAVLGSPWARACGADAPRLEPVAAGAANVWWVRGARGDADATNRGRVANLLVVRDGARVWVVGSGPSRRFGGLLDCAVRRDTGRPISDVISPWPQPELVLGAAGLPRARHWAHADVAAAMRRRCTDCVERLRQRLGPAAADLGPARSAVGLPTRTLRGEHGTLGPLAWWRVERAPGVPVTLWRVRDVPVLTAHGLLRTGSVPDLRDSAIAPLRAATARLASLASANDSLLGEQGEPAPRDEVERHLDYWRALDTAVRTAQARGADGAAAPGVLPGIDAARTAGPAHALNWQRAWRQAEDEALAAPARVQR